MHAFWQHGFEATSMCDLECATGLKRISIYNAFGDKEGLFLAALDLYIEEAKPPLEEQVSPKGLQGISDFLLNLCQPVEEDAPCRYGCLMVNVLLDLQRASEKVQSKVKTFRNMLHTAFTNALNVSVEKSEMQIGPEVIQERAEFLVGCVWGIVTSIRLHGNPTSVMPMTKVILETIESWKD